MTLSSGIALVRRHVTRSRSHFLFAGVGLVVGSATLVFFLALSAGIRERVLNRLYPVNQVELQPETVRLFGLGIEVPVRLDRATMKAMSHLPGVVGVFPKQRSKFPARLWGGRDVLGYEARLEAFFDGIEPGLIRDELRATEQSVLGPEDLGVPCRADGDCGSGATCRGERCRRATYWDAFRDQGGRLACGSDTGCLPGEACLRGSCGVRCDASTPCGAGRVCVGAECRRACVGVSDCEAGEACVTTPAGGACRRLACRLANADVQLHDDVEALRGDVAPFADAPAASLPGHCPEGTYCATLNTRSVDGACEAPIPVIVSPFLLDVYNSVAATAMGLSRLSGLEVVLGVRFAMLYGESYFAADAQVEKREVRRARVVGFSPKAMDFGVTAPLGYVERANAFLRGRDSASEATSVIVETGRNEDVPSVVEDAKVLGLTLAPRSEEGRKAANVLLVLTIVFAMVSLVILGISAINITHTFLMLVTERRQEIAIYRAVGATLLDIRLLILGEAAALGLLGGVGGIGAAWALSRGANALAAGLLEHVPGSPSDLFVFGALAIAAGLGCSVLFALVGAFVPSRKAARTDPATVLSQG